MSIESILTEAMTKHQSGDLDAAETLYRNILTIDPGDPDVLNLLGVLSLQCQKLDDAGQLISKAIKIDPTIAEYHFNLGEVLIHKGDHSAAMDSYKRSLEIKPDLDIAKEKVLAFGNESEKHSEIVHEPLKRYEVIQAVIDHFNANTYLEIGIDSGESFVKISADRKFGVDPMPTNDLINQLLENVGIRHFKYTSTGAENTIAISMNATGRLPSGMPVGKNAEFFYETSDLFFSQHAALLFKDAPIDVAFIDGLHTYEQTYIDVVNALNFISDNGIILMHDCNPPTEASAFPASSWEEAAKTVIPGWDGLWCGDVWKSVVRLRATRNDLKVFVLDCDFGIGVVCKGEPESMLDIQIPEISHLTYSDLHKNRNEMLNLKPQKYLYEFLAKMHNR